MSEAAIRKVMQAFDDLQDTDFDRGTRLRTIAKIIERAEARAMASHWPLCSTREELTDNELAEIFGLAKGWPQKQKETNADARAVESPRGEANS